MTEALEEEEGNYAEEGKSESYHKLQEFLVMVNVRQNVHFMTFTLC